MENKKQKTTKKQKTKKRHRQMSQASPTSRDTFHSNGLGPRCRFCKVRRTWKGVTKMVCGEEEEEEVDEKATASDLQSSFETRQVLVRS